MLGLLLFSGALLLLNFLFLYIKFTNFRDDYFYNLFLGNYIFFSHYFFIIVLILFIINTFIFKIPKTFRNGTIILFLIISGVVGYINYSKSQIIHTEITLNKKANVDKLRIAFISDLHLTYTSNKKMFTEAFEKINEAKPDIILIGGDLIDFSHTQIKDDYSDIFSNLKSKYGTYAILGNHEYYGGIEGNEEYIKNLGINILRDDILTIDGVHIIGRDDHYTKARMEGKENYKSVSRNNLKTLLKDKNIGLEEPIVVLDHNPQYILEALNIADLQLSGHTHNGQFFPYNLVVKKMYENPVGYKNISGLHSVVSAGLGSWQIPYRIGSTSQINIVDINLIKEEDLSGMMIEDFDLEMEGVITPATTNEFRTTIEVASDN